MLTEMNNDKSSTGKAFGLTPYLSPLAVIALSFGYAVGWGAFVLPGTMLLPKAGPAGTLLGFLIGTAAISVLAFNYHLMTKHVKGSGGAFGFVTDMFGHDHGFLVAWFLLLTYMAIMWANATALVLLARYLFGNALQFGFHYTVFGFDIYLGEVLLSTFAIALCGCVCLVSKRLAIRLHTLLAIALFAGIATCFIAALLKHEGGLGSMAPAFSSEGIPPLQILWILSMVPWAFVGFEAVSHSSEEFCFPTRKLFSLLLAAIIISGLAYILLALLPVLALPESYSTWTEYLDNLHNLEGIGSVPVFFAARKALGPLGTAVIGGSMLAGQLTALFATFIAVSRLLHAMSKSDIIPSWFSQCNSDGTPTHAILTVMLISFPVPFLGRTVIGWPVDLSNLGAAIAYGYTSAAALALLKREKNHGTAEKAAGVFGVVVSIFFSLLMLIPDYHTGSSLSTESYLLLAFWCFLGFALYRRAFRLDTKKRFGHSIVVWVTVLIVIFFSSLMWFRLAVCKSAEHAYKNFVGMKVTQEAVSSGVANTNADMLFKSIVELCILVASLSIMLNIFSLLHKREKNLMVEKLKAEETANKSKSYFFSTVNHDIRTPLNAIIGFSQMLKMGFKTEEEREQALNAIIISCKTLLHLVNDMLDFSKLEDRRMVLSLKPTDCASLHCGLVDFFRLAYPNSPIEFRAIAGKMPPLLVDAQHLHQILFNLVDNAAKFTRSGFVEVRSSFDRPEGADTGTLRFEIEDSGCGISEEDLKRIASPYIQVDSKLARHGGTGLGLAICQQLTHVMGGELSIASTLGKGSTFTVTIPKVKVSDASEVKAFVPTIDYHILTHHAAAQPETMASAKEKPNKPQPAKAVTRRILIVDDQKMNLMVLKTMLKKLGTFDIVSAMNGKEALDILQEQSGEPFECVLTDMWMPVMDGEELVRAIRADDKLSSLPVHVITADSEMQGRFSEIGFASFLLKPVTVEKLQNIIS